MSGVRLHLATRVLDALAPRASGLVGSDVVTVRKQLLQGLPDTLSLAADVEATLIAPSGEAIRWRDVDPATLISSSAGQVESLIPATPVPGAVGQSPARLLIRVGGSLVGSIPLAIGSRSIGDAGQPGAGVALELAIVAWELRAGSLRGPGDVGSWIEIAWRRADVGVPRYSTPPPSPRLTPRLKPAERIESEVGVRDLRRLILTDVRRLEQRPIALFRRAVR